MRDPVGIMLAHIFKTVQSSVIAADGTYSDAHYAANRSVKTFKDAFQTPLFKRYVSHAALNDKQPAPPINRSFKEA